MKSTGIIRKVDNLSRMVIPKELKRTMQIDPKDPLEIYLDATLNLNLYAFCKFSNILS